MVTQTLAEDKMLAVRTEGLWLMDSAAEDLKDPKGGLDILLVRSHGQSFFCFCFLLAYNLQNLNSSKG